jgi:hypothetical protein
MDLSIPWRFGRIMLSLVDAEGLHAAPFIFR